MALGDVGRLLLITGVVIAVIGGVIVVLTRLNVTQVPGSISVSGGSVSFFFPVLFCVVASVVLTVVINLFVRPPIGGLTRVTEASTVQSRSRRTGRSRLRRRRASASVPTPAGRSRRATRCPLRSSPTTSSITPGPISPSTRRDRDADLLGDARPRLVGPGARVLSLDRSGTDVDEVGERDP